MHKSAQQAKAQDLPPLVVTSLNHLDFLVIEDNPAELRLVHSILTKTGANDIIAVTSATEAARILATRHKQVDCIICDQKMDDVSGIALLQRIRSGRNPFIQRDIRFIMMTGYSNVSLVEGAKDLDVSGFVLKPAEIGNVMKAIQLAFSNRPRLKSPREYESLNLVDA